jgi:nucleoside-diphosphate-sugar epimerase
VRETHVAVTGATGFVGRHLAMRLLAEDYRARGLVRRAGRFPGLPLDVMPVGAVDGSTDWSESLAGVDVVVHLAARTHAVRERNGGDIADYRPTNVDGTRRLAEAAAESGVRRLVFVSSIKVNGERTSTRPFRAGDRPAPEDAYGWSKWEAEQVVAEVASKTGLETVVVRPPLVYGPGAKGNFARLCKAVRRGFVLPLGAVKNRRSLVAVDNLVDLLVRCITHPAAPGQTFLVSDGEDLSTPELIRRIARAMGKRAPMLPVPVILLRTAGWLTGTGAEVGRLLGSLQVDMEHTRQALNWEPPVTVDQGVEEAVAGV